METSMMDMKSMMKSPEVAKETSLEEKARYPYGLELSLEDDSLTKLGIDCADCEIGEKVIIRAVAEITSISQNSSNSGEENRTMRLQIQKLNLKFQNNFEESFDEAAGKKDE